VRIAYQLTPDDYYKGLLAFRGIKAWRRWLLRSAYVVVGLTIPICLLITVLRPRPEDLKVAFAGLGFAALWFTYMLAGPRFSAGRQFKASPSAQSPVEIEISNEGLFFHSAYAESKVSWSAYVAWGENKSTFVILPQPRIYFPIPKRAFTPEQIGEFREVLRRNVRKK
jgi:YcxB-like protein